MSSYTTADANVRGSGEIFFAREFSFPPSRVSRVSRVSRAGPGPGTLGAGHETARYRSVSITLVSSLNLATYSLESASKRASADSRRARSRRASRAAASAARDAASAFFFAASSSADSARTSARHSEAARTAGGAAGTDPELQELQEEPPEEPPEVPREESSEERGARGAGYRRGDGGVVGEGGPLPLPRVGNAPGESRGSALGEAGASGGDRDASQDACGSSRSPALMILMRTMARRARREH